MLPFTLLYLASSLVSYAAAGSVQAGGACSQDHNHLQLGTWRFDGDCDSSSYCAPDGVCVPRGCRRDVFPFGYAPGDELPPMCPQGQFCPDEGDTCQSIMPVGSPCQLNRDDECEAPPNFRELSDDRYGRNSNGSVCLNFQCMWQNVTVGLACVVENTPYIAYGPNGQEFVTIVSRGNCRSGLYCDSQQLVCMRQKDIGESCEADKECSSNNCLTSQTCGKEADAPAHLPVWVYIIVGIGIFGGMFGTLFTLFFFHRRQRDEEREKRIQYWREQNAFRQNLMQMRETARASLLSLPLGTNGTSPRSTLYSREGMSSEESQLPLTQNQAPKGSGLKHTIADDNEEYDSDRIVTEREADSPRYRSGRAF